MVIAAALIVAACVRGTVDLTVVNHCDHALRIATFEGLRDANGNWVAAPEPRAQFEVGANQTIEHIGAFDFSNALGELRIVEPVQRSYVINLDTDLDKTGRWIVPTAACAPATR